LLVGKDAEPTSKTWKIIIAIYPATRSKFMARAAQPAVDGVFRRLESDVIAKCFEFESSRPFDQANATVP
jgi:hypothetical protein